MQQMMKGVALVALGLALAAGAAYAQPTPPPDPCIVPNNGAGTVTLPPAGCSYLSPDQVHLIIAGLPNGTTIILKPIHTDFICRKLGFCDTPGGPLGGAVEDFTSTAVFQVSGTGALAGWNRVLKVPLAVQTATAPRGSGPVQSFKTEMLRIDGSISGDPDFASFDVKGGTLNGYSSPGKTTLTQQPSGDFRVDSSFDVGYAISFTGAPGGKLRGFSGTTEGTVTMTAAKPCLTAEECACK
jgi:hypothetical protein